MAEKKVSIVIKKIDGGGAGAHGGGWKVAFADFMTAMMCFFLVMWLVAQSSEVKSDVASYFSGPSMLEHDFSSYGAELTLEKLFLDLVNEPLKTAQNLLQPVDFTPNLMAMGSKKIVLQFIATEIGPLAKNVTIEKDSIEFEILERYLFIPGTAEPSPQFVETMEKIKAVTLGLEDSKVEIEAIVYQNTVAGQDYSNALRVASNRKDLVGIKIKSSFENATNSIFGKGTVLGGNGDGTVKIKVGQKELTSDGRKPRELEDLFNKDKKEDLDVYNDFVRRVTQDKKKSKTK